MNLNIYIETFLSWPLIGRTACILFVIVFLLGLLVGKYLLRLLSVIPFLLDKLFRGLYMLIEFPIDALHRKYGGTFYDIENAAVHVAEKLDSLLTRWHARWLHAKTPVMLVLFLYLGAVLFTGVIPAFAGTTDSPVAKGETLYLKLESGLTKQAEEHGLYTTPEKIIQNSIFMKIDNTHILQNGGIKSLDFPIVLHDGRPYLPVRDISTALGGTVDWDSKTQEALVYLGKNEIRLSTASPEVSVNGEKTSLLNDLLPITVDTKMYIDAQAFSDLLGFHIRWLPEHRLIAVSPTIDHSFGPLTLQTVEEKFSPYSQKEKIISDL